jgi:hypothetical protein
MKRFQFFPLLILCCLFLFTGCSDKVQVKGKVTLTDGTPLARGQVIFEQDAFSARGDILSDGTYVMGSLKSNDGLPKGEYVVYISGATEVGGSFEFTTMGGGGQAVTTSMPSLTPVIALKYTSGSTSPLRCNVTKSMTWDIEVPPAGM